MHCNGALAAFLSLSSLAFGSPAPLQKRSFSVTQRQNQADLDGPAALRRAYLKHGLELPAGFEKRQVPPSPSPAAALNQTGSVIALTDQNDLEYLSPVSVGGTTMRMDFDTGSSDLWVFSDRLPEFQRKGHAFYTTAGNTTGEQKQSSGQEKQGFTWKISYGDGSGASGIVFADKVQIGAVTATSQAVEAATSVSQQFVSENSDGLLGLGFGKTNTVKPDRQLTFFENVKPVLKEPLFTVSLKKNATGTYDFGFVDKTKYTGPIQYIPINTTRGYWEYTATGYQVGTSPAIPMNFQSIADTGTTLMLLPPQATKDYYAQVPGAASSAKEGGYTYPCGTKLPDLTVLVSDAKLKIPATFLDRGASATGSGRCYGGIQQGADSLSIWGDIFLKSQFTIFDGQDPPRIGFAQQAIEVVNIGSSPALTADPSNSKATTTGAPAATVSQNGGSRLRNPVAKVVLPFLNVAKKLAGSQRSTAARR